jgi:hypothetical protein
MNRKPPIQVFNCHSAPLQRLLLDIRTADQKVDECPDHGRRSSTEVISRIRRWMYAIGDSATLVSPESRPTSEPRSSWPRYSGKGGPRAGRWKPRGRTLGPDVARAQRDGTLEPSISTNIVEQDHRGVKRRLRPMLGWTNFGHAAITIARVELLHRIRKNQFALSRLRVRGRSTPEIFWNAVLAAGGAASRQDLARYRKTQDCKRTVYGFETRSPSNMTGVPSSFR